MPWRLTRDRKIEPDPPAPKNHSERTRAEIEAFIEQARWLIEYHDRRGDSFTARATALLGFSGVVLALILRGPLPPGVTETDSIRAVSIATVLLLLNCATFSLIALIPSSSSAPGVDELRTKWTAWLSTAGRGKALGDIADSYFMAHPASEDIPVIIARDRANRRSTLFITAAAAMLAALISLTILLVLIYSQVN